VITPVAVPIRYVEDSDAGFDTMKTLPAGRSIQAGDVF
jgi:hypothetical protein